jgi:hypothetical protein
MDGCHCLLELMIDSATTIDQKQWYYMLMYCRDAQKHVVMYFAAAIAALWFALLDCTATFQKSRFKKKIYMI